MSENLIQIKAFLGKYYSELLYSAAQEKYKNTSLDKFFEQRFVIQNNKAQMMVDPALHGMQVIITGHDIHISKEFYDHENVIVTNSLENENQATNPKSLYNPEVFSTLAYLATQNHVTFRIVGEIDEPIYVKHKSECESFCNSVVTFDVTNEIAIEVVEEIESFGALNVVTNYTLNPSSKVNLTTFYNNNLAALSFMYRNIMCGVDAEFNHTVLGKGSSNVIDENKLFAYDNSKAEFFGIVNGNRRNFNSILFVQPFSENYRVSVDYRDILYGKSSITFFPVVVGNVDPSKATIVVSNVKLEDIPEEQADVEVKKYISDIVERTTLERMSGVKRFYDNKTRFLQFL